MSQPDEFSPLSAAGLTAFDTDYNVVGRKDHDGNRLRFKGVVEIGGKQRNLYDVLFALAR
jgi:hypothetical protein